MVKKFGVPKRMRISCDVETEDGLVFSGPDPDGDLTIEIDVPQDDAITIGPAKVQKLHRFCTAYLKAVGVEPLSEDADE